MSGRRRVITADRADCSAWPTVAWPALPTEQQKIFRAREDAVYRYCRREPLRAIEAATGITYSSVRRLYERCLQLHHAIQITPFGEVNLNNAPGFSFFWLAELIRTSHPSGSR